MKQKLNKTEQNIYFALGKVEKNLRKLGNYFLEKLPSSKKEKCQIGSFLNKNEDLRVD